MLSAQLAPITKNTYAQPAFATSFAVMRDFLFFIKWAAIVAGSLFLAFIAFCAACCYYTMSPTTSIKKYDAFISRVTKKSAGVATPSKFAHFPDRIPPSATDAKFYSQPGFVDGGYTLLLLTFSAAETASIEQRLRAEHSGLPDEKPPVFPSAMLPKAWLTSGFRDQSAPIDSANFENDFVFFDVSPNHAPGRTNTDKPLKGVAVSQSRHQVLYWLRE